MKVQWKRQKVEQGEMDTHLGRRDRGIKQQEEYRDNKEVGSRALGEGERYDPYMSFTIMCE